MASEKVAKFIDEIKALSVLELAEIVAALKEEFGVSTDMPVAVAAAPASAAPAAAEKTDFTVVLAAAGANKINVIKVVREITGLGLKEAKDFVDGAPKALKEGVDQATADDLKKKLEEAGATVELK